jgi:hypothetical protein
LTVDHARDLGVGDVLDGVGASCILGDADIVIVGGTGEGVIDDIF